MFDVIANCHNMANLLSVFPKSCSGINVVHVCQCVHKFTCTTKFTFKKKRKKKKKCNISYICQNDTLEGQIFIYTLNLFIILN